MGLLLLSSAAAQAGTRDPLALQVWPAVSFAPANLVIRATIEVNAENRAVEIIAESQDLYRSSEIELDGGNAPRSSRFEFRSLPSGVYEVRAILYGSGGAPRAEVRQEVHVVSTGAGR